MYEFEVLFHTLRLARETWRRALLIPFACAVVAAAASYLIHPTFRSAASFIADSGDPLRGLGGMASLAAQFGASVPSSGANQSPQFYAELVKSRELLRSALTRRVADPRDDASGDSVPVIDLIEPPGDLAPLRDEKAIRKLRDAVSVAVSQRTGIIQVSSTTRYPSLSASVTTILLEELDRFNQETRQTQARSRRVFSEQLAAEALDSLRTAEAALESFSERNRSIAGAPSLELVSQRLQRRVAQYQEMFTSVRKEYEVARIDEVNDTPVITVLDPPMVPVVRETPRRTVIALAGLLLGLAWVFAGLLRDAVRVRLAGPGGGAGRERAAGAMSAAAE